MVKIVFRLFLAVYLFGAIPHFARHCKTMAHPGDSAGKTCFTCSWHKSWDDGNQKVSQLSIPVEPVLFSLPGREFFLPDEFHLSPQGRAPPPTLLS